jgi:ribosomal protein S18 acetylase RimI-like enzyme
MKARIRFAKPTDYFLCKSFDTRITNSRFKNIAKEKGIVVATQDSNIVGYLRIELIWLKVPYVSWVMVQQAQRRSGVAKAMIGFIATALKRQGHAFLLSSHQGNALVSRRWHSKLGFKRCGRIAGLNEDGSSEIYCKLKI